MSKVSSTRNRPRGFTLIELVVVMVITAILLAIAIPGYLHQIQQSRRTDAKSALLDLAAREQSVFATTQAYGTTPSSVGYSGAAFPVTVGSGYYQVSVAVTAAVAPTSVTSIGTPASFLLTATPVPGTSQANDTTCASFTLDQSGNQVATSSGGAITTSTCWGS